MVPKRVSCPFYVRFFCKRRDFISILFSGLVVKKAFGDGNCLFRSAAEQIYGDEEMHAVVRKKCMDYLVSNKIVNSFNTTTLRLGQYGLSSFQAGIQNWKYFCLIQHTQRGMRSPGRYF